MSVSLNIYGHTYDGVEGIKAKDTNNDTRVFVLTEDASISSGNQLLLGVTAFGAAGKYTGTIPTKTVTDLTASGDTVIVPAGYYAGQTSKSVNPGSAGTPTATKGTVSNHSVSVTPSVSNTSGYITGGTKTGTAVTVSASELVSGNKSISANGTGIDVINYATVSVSVSGDTPTLQSKIATPTESQQTITPDSGYDALSSVTVAAISSTYVGSGVIRRYDSDMYGEYDQIAGYGVCAPNGYYSNESWFDVPSGTAGTPTASKGAVSNHAISVTPSVTNTTGYITGGTKTGTAVTVSASELVSGNRAITTSGDSIDVTNYATVSVASGSATTPATTVTANPSISVNSTTGLITATASATKSVTPTVSAGYVSSGTAGTITVSGSNTSQLTVQAAKTVTPTETAQTAVAAGRYTTGAVTVAAISSTYVGSGITTRSSTDLTASGATVTVPAGYYASQTSKSVASGSAGTPTASKGTVSNHSVSVTPSVTNTTGYITGGTKTGTAVTVTASELVSGNKAITESGTGIDVANYATVSVDVETGADIPIFNILWDSSYTTNTITCNETFAQCWNRYNTDDNIGAYVLMSIDGDSSVQSNAATAVEGQTNDHITYIVSGNSGPTYDIIYHANGTIEYVDPSAYSHELIATENGTYYPSKGVYTYATVNVPSSGTDTSDATLNSSSQLLSGVTAYANGTKYTGILSFVTYYTGSSAPSSSTGSNGDIYLKTS